MDYSRMYISGMDGCGRGLRRNTQLLFMSIRSNPQIFIFRRLMDQTKRHYQNTALIWKFKHVATSQYYEKRGVIEHHEVFVQQDLITFDTYSWPEIEGTSIHINSYAAFSLFTCFTLMCTQFSWWYLRVIYFHLLYLLAKHKKLKTCNFAD